MRPWVWGYTFPLRVHRGKWQRYRAQKQRKAGRGRGLHAQARGSHPTELAKEEVGWCCESDSEEVGEGQESQRGGGGFFWNLMSLPHTRSLPRTHHFFPHAHQGGKGARITGIQNGARFQRVRGRGACSWAWECCCFLSVLPAFPAPTPYSFPRRCLLPRIICTGSFACRARTCSIPRIPCSRLFSQMIPRSPAFLAPAPFRRVLADASSPAILALAPSPLVLAGARRLMLQLLEATAFMHEQWEQWGFHRSTGTSRRRICPTPRAS